MTDPAIIGDYDRWLHVVANRIGTAEMHDDLVQEGRVAMWRALEKYDETRGALPSWLTRAAEQRMKDVAWGSGQPFGHEAVRGARPVEVVAHLDEQPEAVQEALLGYVEEAYQDGEVLRAIRELSPADQEYIFLRFWGGLDPKSQAPQTRALVKRFPVLAERWRWTRAKAVLAERLEHLAA